MCAHLTLDSFSSISELWGRAYCHTVLIMKCVTLPRCHTRSHFVSDWKDWHFCTLNTVLINKFCDNTLGHFHAWPDMLFQSPTQAKVLPHSRTGVWPRCGSRRWTTMFPFVQRSVCIWDTYRPQTSCTTLMCFLMSYDRRRAVALGTWEGSFPSGGRFDVPG